MAKFWFACIIMSIYTGTCGQTPPIVGHVDLPRYAGLWFDIASYPAAFQEGCHCTTAEYEIIPGKAYMRVVNRCIRFTGGEWKMRKATGRARVVEGTGNAWLKVQFFWPFQGDYLIIGLADDYSWAVVGHPKKKYLWILSRESYMPTDTYNSILRLVRAKGYDPALLKKTPHNCDSNP